MSRARNHIFSVLDVQPQVAHARTFASVMRICFTLRNERNIRMCMGMNGRTLKLKKSDLGLSRNHLT